MLDRAAAGDSTTAAKVSPAWVKVGTVRVVLSLVTWNSSIQSPVVAEMCELMVAEMLVAAATAAPSPTGVAHDSPAPLLNDFATAADGVAAVTAALKVMTGFVSEAEVASFQKAQTSTPPPPLDDAPPVPLTSVATFAQPAVPTVTVVGIVACLKPTRTISMLPVACVGSVTV